MSISIAETVAAIHSSGTRFVLALTGGGSRTIGELLEVPGGSRSLLEAVVAYSPQSLVEWLGATPERYCAGRTARAMAMAAFERARRLATAGETVAGAAVSPESRLVGIGSTASLVSDRPKRGPHRAHVAIQAESLTATWSIELVKGRRDRVGEERLVAALVINAIAEACGITERIETPLEKGEERVELVRTDAQPEWRELLAERTRAVRHGGTTDQSAGPPGIFPGAFNPIHEGHLQMAEVAGEILACRIEFEISIINVDKPPLDFTDLEGRLAEFSPSQTVWFTRAATFVEKAEIFPGATFVVGADTIRRIAEPHYYGGGTAARDAAIAALERAGVRFLVFGRKTNAGFESLWDLALPARLAAMCGEVPPERFRLDVSSTQLRRQAEE